MMRNLSIRGFSAKERVLNIPPRCEIASLRKPDKELMSVCSVFSMPAQTSPLAGTIVGSTKSMTWSGSKDLKSEIMRMIWY